MLAAIGVAMLGGIATASAAAGGGGNPPEPNYWAWVCKYVGQPGVDEVLKEGKQPIRVDYKSTVPVVGSFNDRQGGSYVLALASQDETTYEGEGCHSPDGPEVVAPEYDPATCTLPETIILVDGLPPASGYYSWTLSADGLNYIASPKVIIRENGEPDPDGELYTLTGQTSFPVTIGEPNANLCPRTITPATPEYTPATCDAPRTIVDPVKGEHYTWALDQSGKNWVAHAADGYTLAAGDWSFPVTIGDPDASQCPRTITPATPEYTPATCDAPRTIIDPVKGEHYTWALDESHKNWVASADADYTLAEGDWSFPVTIGVPNASLCPTIRTFNNPDVPGIWLVKSYTLSGTDALADVGETISYSFLVTNTGNVALSSVAVVDLMAGVTAVSCPSTVLAVAATFTCTASYIVTPANVTGVDITNEANASGKPPTGGWVEATAFVKTPTAPPAVAPAGEVKGVVKNAPVKAAPAPAVAPAVKTLAFTGAETVPLGLSGLLALLLGAVLTVASRQRPKQARE